DLAFGLPASRVRGEVPRGRRIFGRERARRTPLVNGLRDLDRLAGVAVFREYQFDWPERICMDSVLDAERLGAIVKNYTPVTQLVRQENGWRITLGDASDDSAAPEVTASVVLNMAGIWIDRVNSMASSSAKLK